MHSPTLVIAYPEDLAALLPLVRSYHRFEGIRSSGQDRSSAIAPLLGDNPYGRIWMIVREGAPVGYLALCFGYSVEFGGRDAFVDEFFLIESARGHGLGRLALDAVRREASRLDVRVLHLEVARSNRRARRFYESLGFSARARFHLMSCRLDGRSREGH